MSDPGERIVMSIAVTAVLVSLFMNHLYCEFTSLLLLALAALIVHTIVASQDKFLHLFSPRHGTSSGLYMGALTIPCVLAARLIQQSRISAATPQSPAQIEEFKLDYFYALEASASLLAYILWRVSCHEDEMLQSNSKSVAKTCYSICWRVILFTSLVPVFFLGINLATLAILFATSVSLLQYGINGFPHCASLGESFLISNGLAVYSNNAITYTLSKIGGESEYGIIPIHKDNISAILQGLLIGLVFVPWLQNAISGILLSTIHIQKEKTKSDLYNGGSFLMALVIAFVIVTQGWLHCVHGLENNLVIWITNFVLEDIERLYLSGYWIICIISMCTISIYLAKTAKVEIIMLRKVFHAMVVVMFTPAILTQLKFLQLAFAVALVVFVMVEMIRSLSIPPFGEHVGKFMATFTDARDSDLLIISHFSLLLGCSLPLWLMNSQNDRPLAPFAGVFSIGIGDTMASVIGHHYGSLHLLGTKTRKTVEGLVASIVSMFLACFIALLYLQIPIIAYEQLVLILSVLCTGLMEAYTSNLDNVFLPLLFYFLLII